MKLVIKNILITGGAGYIGSHVAELLIKNTTNKVIILDNLITGHKKLINKKAKFIKADIKNKKRLSTIIKENKIDSIIMLLKILSLEQKEIKKNIIITILLVQRI